MATEVIVTLPENVYNQASRLAQLMNRDVARILAEALENAFSPLGSATDRLMPVDQLSDSEVLAAADLRMEETQGKRLGRLLDHQQTETLSDEERSELAALMQVYHENLVRKAQALGEAVRRGLRGP